MALRTSTCRCTVDIEMADSIDSMPADDWIDGHLSDVTHHLEEAEDDTYTYLGLVLSCMSLRMATFVGSIRLCRPWLYGGELEWQRTTWRPMLRRHRSRQMWLRADARRLASRGFRDARRIQRSKC